MNRRKFLKGISAGLVALAVTTKLATSELKYEYRTYKMGFDISEETIPEEVMKARSEALARAMTQTREHMIANVARRAFG